MQRNIEYPRVLHYGVDVPEVTLPPQKRLCIALCLRYEIGESSFAVTARPTGGFRSDYGFAATLDDEIRRDPERDVGYEITDTWDEMLVGMPGEPATDDTELGGSTAFRDRRVASVKPQETGIIHQGTKTAEDTTDPSDSTSKIAGTSYTVVNFNSVVHFTKIALKRTARSTPATTTTTTTTFGTNAQLKALIDQSVANALAARDADKSQNGKDSHDSGMGVRRQAPPAHECTYQDFMKCKPLYFKGTKGVFELTQCALTWWNSHVTTVDPDVSYTMTWTNLKNKMTDNYCPGGEINKLKGGLWNLTVTSNDMVGYNQRFQELALLCVQMFSKESDKVERYVGGLPT
nr:hypothetical protein [Tanacetum cinerariifolium]